MWKLKLNDGTEFDMKMCGAADGVLWIEMPGLGMLEAATIFSDKEKTKVITAYENVVHENYTKLISLILREETISIALRKEI